MRLYLFTVPQHLATPALEASLSEEFGGYTRLESVGAWQDTTGAHCIESNAVYLVAVPGLGTAHLLREFVLTTLRFGKEKAAFLAEIGTAEVISLRG